MSLFPLVTTLILSRASFGIESSLDRNNRVATIIITNGELWVGILKDVAIRSLEIDYSIELWWVSEQVER